MSFLFTILDLVLTTVLLFDTLGLVYIYRKKGDCDGREYTRVCLSWFLFITISNVLSCNWLGFIGTLVRLLIFAAKVFVTIPLLGGTMKLYNYLIEEKKGEEIYNKIVGIIKSKLCKSCSSESCGKSESSCSTGAKSRYSSTVGETRYEIFIYFIIKY